MNKKAISGWSIGWIIVGILFLISIMMGGGCGLFIFIIVVGSFVALFFTLWVIVKIVYAVSRKFNCKSCNARFYLESLEKKELEDKGTVEVKCPTCKKPNLIQKDKEAKE